MGTQIKYSFGYGIKAPEDTEDINFWDVIEDNFPLLEYCLSGDYWNEKNVGAVVVAKSSLKEKTGYGLANVGELITKLDDESQKELNLFILLYCSQAEPDYMVWSYTG